MTIASPPRNRSSSVSTSSYHSCASTLTPHDCSSPDEMCTVAIHGFSPFLVPDKPGSYFYSDKDVSTASISRLRSTLSPQFKSPTLNPCAVPDPMSRTPRLIYSFRSTNATTPYDASKSKSRSPLSLKMMTKSEPLPADLEPNSLHPSNFEDDFTKYLDKLLLRVLENNDPNPNPSTSSINSDEEGDHSTPVFPYVSVSVLTKDLSDESADESGSCSYSECSSAWTSRGSSVLQSEAQAALSYYEPSSTQDFGSHSTSVSRQSSRYDSIRSQADSLDSQQPLTSVSPRTLISAIRYDSKHSNEGDLSSNEKSSSRSSFFGSNSDRTPIQILKRRLSSGREIKTPFLTSADSWEIPPFKKRKLGVAPGSSDSKSFTTVAFPAIQPASLRRGLSLLLEDDYSFPGTSKTSAIFPPHDSNPSSPIVLAPTVPTTPIPAGPPHIFVRNNENTEYYQPPPHVCISNLTPIAVPIIAPPRFDMIPRAPFSTEDAAEDRLKRLLQKEKRLRENDGFPSNPSPKPTTRTEANETKVYIDIDDEDTTSEEEDSEYSEDEEMVAILPDHIQLNAGYTCNLGIEEDFRQQITKWMLNVLPLMPNEVCSKLNGIYKFSPDLCDQLSTSPETRFQAIYMFIRYILRAVGQDYNTGERTKTSAEHPSDIPRVECQDSCDMDPSFLANATSTILWDVAVGCLALSVKLHRDFLEPLCPVYAMDFLSLAPHHMAYDDLETCQRDILQAFSYSLGHNTPQPFIDELWLALPSLRGLLNFKDGWKIAQKQTWVRLLGAISAPDILRFPISLLTVSALISGIIVSLIGHYESEADIYYWQRQRAQGCVCRSSDITERGAEEDQMRRNYMRCAVQATESIITDFQDILLIQTKDLRECRLWFAELNVTS